MSSAARRAAELRREIERHIRLYHEKDAPEITDAHGVECLLIRNGGDFRQCGGAEFVQRVAHLER